MPTYANIVIDISYSVFSLRGLILPALTNNSLIIFLLISLFYQILIYFFFLFFIVIYIFRLLFLLISLLPSSYLLPFSFCSHLYLYVSILTYLFLFIFLLISLSPEKMPYEVNINPDRTIFTGICFTRINSIPLFMIDEA